MVGLGIKVVHLVVEHDTGSGHHDPAAEIQIHRLGGGHGVAVCVNDGQMGRTGRFNFSRWRRWNTLAGCGFGDIYLRPHVFCVCGRDEALHRNGHKVRITQVTGSIAKGPAQGFCQDMRGGGSLKAEFLQRKSRQDIQHLNQQNATGARRRHGIDTPSLKTARHRRAVNHGVLIQIVLGQQAACPLHFRNNCLCHPAGVKGGLAVLGNGAQGIGQVFLDKDVVLFERLVVPVIHGPGCVGFSQDLGAVGNGAGQMRIDRKSLVCQTDGGLHDLCER